jgi:hypothetical protein
LFFFFFFPFSETVFFFFQTKKKEKKQKKREKEKQKKYKIRKLSEVQPDRESHVLYAHGGLWRIFLRHMFCQFSNNTDSTVRPVLKHGPRSSTGVQVVALN